MEPSPPSADRAPHSRPTPQELQQLYHLLVEERRDYAIFTMDPTGRVMTWNAGARRLFGYSPDEVVGQTIHRLFTPSDVEAGAPEQELGTALEQGRSEDTRWHVRKDGSYVWTSGSVEPIGNGHLRGFAKVVRDQTESKQSTDALRRSEETLRCVIEGIKDYAVFMLDPQGRVATWNPGAQRIKGWRAEEIIGHYYGVLATPQQQADGRPEEHLKLALANGRFEEDNWRIRKDGTYYWASIVIYPSYDALGQLLGFVKVVRDITERKKAEEERDRLLESERKARAEAEEANRAKDQFLATVSHELRTPLTAILGWAALLRRHHTDRDMLDEGLETIERNATAQTKLIEDILDVSRIISGRLKLNSRPTDLADVVSAAAATVRPAADAKRIRLTFRLEPLPPVDGDPDRLQQVVWNLLTNAVKFTPEGGEVTVRATAQRDVPPGGVRHVTVEVRDSGVGIPPAFLPHVFAPFRQADAGTTRRHGGLGLGLAIVKHLVELHGGTVVAASSGEGRGATFTVTLPTAVTAGPRRTAAPAEGRPAGAPRAAAAYECPPLEGVRVLLVDDDPDSRRVVARFLGECRADVTEAASAREAIHVLSEPKRVDVLVSDIGMPDEDGYSLVRRLRTLESQSSRPTLPAVALTAFARPEDRDRATGAGFNAYLAKPVAPKDLLALVASLVGRSFNSGAGTAPDWAGQPDFNPRD